MSPRTSEQDRRLEAIEALVCRDVGRKTQALIDANLGGLADAAASLAMATRVGLITGFFVPRGDVAAPETDGPVGTALLAAALAACGVPARIAVDTPSVEAVRAAVRATGEAVIVDEIVLGDDGAIDALAEVWRQENLSHVVAIERCGRSADGKPRNMRGVDVSPWTLPLDSLFEGGDWTKVAVGDGGNEVGMGKLPAGLIARHVPNGAEIACVTSCDHLVVAGVSNWGAYGLMAALAVLRPDWRPTIAKFLTAERDFFVTDTIVREAGAVDGVTAQRVATVDGFGPEIHGPLVDRLGRIAWGEGAH
ncbi:glutamate cyclase domain-containing protein [Reyranella sp.]|uniref:glutamate cyclase domain-containing protein n=1 Tax=Reyranella sp. TaxID=1929291 RepID=UPI003C7B908A